MANTTNLDLVKPLGTDHALISQINGNMDKIDAYAGNVNSSLNSLGDGLAIIANGDTHVAITTGQFVYVRGHNMLTEGLYTATTNIAANVALTANNLSADASGGLNVLNSRTTTQEMLSGDLNNVGEGQVYASGTTTNRPVYAPFIVKTYDYGTNGKAQIAFKRDSADYMYFRVCNGGTWYAWQQLALNSNLNSKFETEIASNTNLNNLTSPGIYYSPSASVTNSLSNCPDTGYNFTMIVMTKGSGNTTQVIYWNGNAIFSRTTVSGTFGGWYKYNGTAV